MSAPVIEHWFSAHSAFAWLGFRRLLGIAAEHGAEIRHAPMPLAEVVEAAGGVPFAARPAAHVAHFFGREIARWAEIRGRPWIGRTPTGHRRGHDLANRTIIAAELAGHDPGALAWVLLSRHWEADADLSDPGALARLIAEAGLPAEILAAADGAEARARHDANRDEAIARSVFGSPTYVVDGDMFYGQDRLEMVARACRRPFAPTPAG